MLWASKLSRQTRVSRVIAHLHAACECTLPNLKFCVGTFSLEKIVWGHVPPAPLRFRRLWHTHTHTHTHTEHTHTQRTHAHIESLSYWSASVYPNCLQTVSASSCPNWSSQIVPHCPLQYTSTSPCDGYDPLINRNWPGYGSFQIGVASTLRVLQN